MSAAGGVRPSLICCHKVISHLDRQCKDANTMLHESKVEVAHLRTALGGTQSMAEAGRTLVLEAVDEYLEGYEKTLLHVQTFFPSLDLQPCKPYMRVNGGRLIDSTKRTRAKTSRETPEVGQAREVLLMMLNP